MKQLHPIQIKILEKLIFSEGLHYVNLKPDKDMENNKFDWHLKQIMKAGLIAKQAELYALTKEGRKYCNRIDTDHNEVAMQGKISALMVCLRNINGYNEFLMSTRKKHPFFNCQGFASGKIRWGESIPEAAARELFEETGLKGKCEIINLWHYLVQDEDATTKEDKYFFICRFVNPTGDVLKNNIEGVFEWVREEDVSSWIKKPYTDKNEILTLMKYALEIKEPLTLSEMQISNDKF